MCDFPKPLSEQHVPCMCLGFELGSGIYVFLKSVTGKLGHPGERFKTTIESHIMET